MSHVNDLDPFFFEGPFMAIHVLFVSVWLLLAKPPSPESPAANTSRLGFGPAHPTVSIERRICLLKCGRANSELCRLICLFLVSVL